MVCRETPLTNSTNLVCEHPIKNLVICLSPNVLWAPNAASSFEDMHKVSNIVMNLVEQKDYIFTVRKTDHIRLAIVPSSFSLDDAISSTTYNPRHKSRLQLQAEYKQKHDACFKPTISTGTIRSCILDPSIDPSTQGSCCCGYLSSHIRSCTAMAIWTERSSPSFIATH